MNSFELIQILCKGFINIEQCGTFTADSRNLIVLFEQFGFGITWDGLFSPGNYFYQWQPSSEAPDIEEYSLKGYYEDPDKGVWYLYKID